MAGAQGAPAVSVPRSLHNRLRRGWKDFAMGRPEDELADGGRTGDRGRGALHISLLVLLAVPVLVGAGLPAEEVAGRWAALLGTGAGLVTAAQLAVERRARSVSYLSVLGSLLYVMTASAAISLVLVLWDGAPFPSHATALLLYTGLLAVISGREEPSLVLSVGAFSAIGYVVVVLVSAGGAQTSLAGMAASLGCLGVVTGLGAQSALRGRSIRRVALCDGLTGLVGREALERCLRPVAARALRTGTPLTIAMLDVDQLDRINRRSGHAFGDALLRWVAGLLRQRFRATDLIGRYDDDTFLVAFFDADHPTLEARMDQVRGEIEGLELPGEGQARGATVSAALATLPRDGNLDAVLRLCAQRLEQGKRAGGNRVVRDG
jgi:diguanylate cyclase (GGDEF)-like protein